MSVVACKVTKNHITVASDSIVVYGDTQRKDVFSKLVEVNEIIVGGSGTCAEQAHLLNFIATRKPERADPLAIGRFLSEFALWKKSNFDDATMVNSYIFVMESKAFRIYDFYVREIDNYDAIGAGRDFALAALHLDKSAKQAISVACELSIYCEAPIICMERDR